jgi:RNA polymerase sigma factor (sigma-70 family)
LRRHGDLEGCEDAAQEALEAAVRQWPEGGVPDNPRAWLIRVASRRLIDQTRTDRARAAREEAVGAAQPGDAHTAPAADVGRWQVEDDSLRLLLLCCHPALTRPSQVALTLRAVSGLTASEIAASFLVPVPTMTQRLSRARATLKAAGPHFALPAEVDVPERVAAVLDVLHLVFNEGYTRTSGARLVDSSLTEEAIRLTRQLRAALPEHDEVAGALALMLLTQARQAVRTDDRGDLVPLAAQDRQRWDAGLTAEGVAILERVLPRGHVGRFQLQAAIAAVHAESPTWADTDWLQISLLYQMLEEVAPSPVVTLNHSVAVGMARGPEAGLLLLGPLLESPVMYRHHRTHAVRAHLLEMAGDRREAARSYARAAQLTASLPEQRYLNLRSRQLGVDVGAAASTS